MVLMFALFFFLMELNSNMYSLNRKKGNPFEQKGNILSRINATYARIVFLFNVIELKHV